MSLKKNAKSARGFTLVELLVVLAILALLAGLVGPRLIGQFGHSKVGVAKVQIADLEKSLDLYKLDVGDYPNTEESLEALVTKPASAKNWNGPYLKGSVPLDPWNHPYKYTNLGNGEVKIDSYGADGVPGGDGDNADISNIKDKQ